MTYARSGGIVWLQVLGLSCVLWPVRREHRCDAAVVHAARGCRFPGQSDGGGPV